MRFMILSTRFWRSFSLACAVWCGLSMEARAQVHQFRNYTAADENGLSDNFVFSIEQDRQGRLWFATSAGASSYDGVEFKAFTMSDGLVNNGVREIYEDRQGRLWFSTTGGLSCLERFESASNAKPVFKNYTKREGLLHDSIEWVLEDKVGNFWIATRGGGLSYFDGRSFRNYGEADGLTAKTVWVLRFDRQGKLWIGSSEGLHSFDGKTFKNYSTREGLPNGSVVSSLLVDNHDKLWVGTRKGLGWFDGARFHPVDLGIGKEIGVPVMLQDQRGALWLGTYGQGLAKLDGSKFTLYQQQNGLAHDQVMALLEDREGNIWIGTQGGGVSKFAGERFVNYTSAQGLARGMIHAVAQDSKGNFWFGNFGGGLCRFDGKNFTHLTTNQGLVNDQVEEILVDSQDRVYVATDGGLSILEGGRFRNYTIKDGLPSNILKALCLDHQGQLWIGTFEGGVVRFDGKYFTRYSSDDGLLNDRISSLWEDRSRRIWFGTDQGVTVLEGGVFRSYDSKDGLGIGKVGAIAEDSKGSMWFGTDSGLSHFDGRSFKTYSTADGLPDQFIHFLQFDRAGRLWIGTRKGISQFDPSRERFRNFSTRDGLLSNLMVEGSCLLDRDGKLWFGSASGVTRCDPDYRDGAAVPPLVHLEDIWVFGETVPRTRLNELRPEENELTFNFVGLSFRDESRVRYRCYLEGSDRAWSTPTNLRFAKYNNLRPGPYRFRVQSSNDDENWSEAAITDLRILPFFYQTSLFRSLVLVVGAGLISGIFKWRVLRIRRLNQELEANVRIRTREVTEQKELLAQTNLELQALQNTSTAISGTLDKVDLGRLILEASMSLLNCPGGFLIDYVWATQSVHVTQALGLASKLKGLTLPVRETISWDVIETRESRILPWDEIRTRVTQPVLRKVLIPCQIVMVPMISSNRVVGILALGREDSSTPFNERDLSLLTTFANQAAVATRNAELYQDMRASESKYRTLVEQAGDAIFVIDGNGLLDSVNPMALRLLGYTEQEFAGLNFLDLVSPEYRRRLTEELQLLVERGSLLESVNLLHKDGRPIPVEINTVSLGNGFYQAIVRDITVRKRLEEDLAKQRDRAEEASRLKSEFLATISHELRTPLHAILSYADFGLERVGHADRERLKRYFFEIQDSGALLLELINDLLDLSKIEAGKMPYRRSTLTMGVVIDDACYRIAQLAEAKGISLNTASIPKEWQVYGDYEMLLRVFINLLGNAIKFTPAGGQIEVFGQARNEGYLFAVRDSGQGIYPEEIDVIFDKFVQSSLHAQRGGSGTGLGLSICRGIVEAHEGRIWAESAGPNQGSTFYFMLPALQAEALSNATPQA
jgi:PAS domain S-box-containing protein